jgi:hypothetical protein
MEVIFIKKVQKIWLGFFLYDNVWRFYVKIMSLEVNVQTWI